MALPASPSAMQNEVARMHAILRAASAVSTLSSVPSNAELLPVLIRGGEFGFLLRRIALGAMGAFGTTVSIKIYFNT